MSTARLALLIHTGDVANSIGRVIRLDLQIFVQPVSSFIVVVVLAVVG